MTMMQFRRKAGDVADRVRLRDEAFLLERRGEVVAVVISPARLERLERAAAELTRLAPAAS
jgi:PHD/YefM family antitoxin component YafN of YafNO toxin-antitoxin module